MGFGALGAREMQSEERERGRDKDTHTHTQKENNNRDRQRERERARQGREEGQERNFKKREGRRAEEGSVNPKP